MPRTGPAGDHHCTDRSGDWKRDDDRQPRAPVSSHRLHHLAGDHASRARRSRLGAQPRSQSDLEQRAGDDDAVLAGPGAHVQRPARRAAAGENPAAAGVPHDRRHPATPSAEHDHRDRRSRRAAGERRLRPALEHAVALRRGCLAAARPSDADRTDWAGVSTACSNHDLRKPALLAPLLGSDGLGPTRRNWTTSHRPQA